MKVIVGWNVGYCYGVKRALSGTLKELEKSDDISCLGKLIHNQTIMNELTDKGLDVVDNIEDAKDKVIIRAHGVSEETYEKAKYLNKEIYDYTCPNVLKIHAIASEYSKKDYYIILVGKKNHPEVVGTISFCGPNSCIVESIEDVNSLRLDNIKNLLIISQTTFNIDEFNKIVDEINKRFKIENIIIKNTICAEPIRRQEEANELSKEVDYMVVVGDKSSSNAKELYNKALKNCEKTILINNESELPNEVYSYNKVGVISSASTSIETVNNVVKVLKKY